MSLPAHLKSLLDAEHALAPQDAQGRTQPRAMALHAAWRLGASARQLQALSRCLQDGRPAAEPVQPWDLGQPWADGLGQIDQGPHYRDLFAQWLEQESAGDLLQQVLPRLLQGPAAAGFDALLRTAHAVGAAHRGELADALAWWAARWLPLPAAAPGVGLLPAPPGAPAASTASTDDPEAVLRQLRRVALPGTASSKAKPSKPVPAPAGWEPFPTPAHLQRAASVPGFAALSAQLRPAAASPATLAPLLARAAADSGHPALLQLLAACAALDVLLPFLDPQEPAHTEAALSAFWRALLATVSASSLALREPDPGRPALDWSALKSAALQSQNPRRLLGLHAAWHFESSLAQRAQPGLWLRAAQAAHEAFAAGA